MSGSLLKSNGWFLRPPHLKKTVENNPLPSPYFLAPARPEPTFVPPEEELYIRKCCPVTLNHLLPDLYLTQKHQVEDSLSEFDTNLTLKFERHLDESHSVVSCSNSSENEEPEEEKSNGVCIENAINLHILQNEKVKYANKHLLKPHIVNYPEPEMKDSSISPVTLNNKYSALTKERTFPSTIQCARNVQRIASEIVDFQCLDSDIHNITIPFKNNKQIQPLVKNRDVLYTPSKIIKNSSVEQRSEKQYNPFDRTCTPITPIVEFNSRYFFNCLSFCIAYIKG